MSDPLSIELTLERYAGAREVLARAYAHDHAFLTASALHVAARPGITMPELAPRNRDVVTVWTLVNSGYLTMHTDATFSLSERGRDTINKRLDLFDRSPAWSDTYLQTILEFDR